LYSYCQFAFEESPARCHICDRAVPLETSKADEYGRAIHEDCYVDRLVLNGEAARPTLPRKPSFLGKPKDDEPKGDERKDKDDKEWGSSALTRTMFRRRNSLRMPPWSADVGAVVALAIVAWFAYAWFAHTDHRQASPPEASKAVYVQQATGVTAPEAASSTFRRILGQNEVDYITEDVTIRIFKDNPEASPIRVAYKEVNFGKDVTVRYISPKPTVRPKANTGQPEDSSSPVSDQPVSRPPTR
jgi:hypothetical protein